MMRKRLTSLVRNMESMVSESGRRYQRPKIMYKVEQTIMNNYIDMCNNYKVQPNKAASRYLVNQQLHEFDFSGDVLSIFGFKAFCEAVQISQLQQQVKELGLRYNNLDGSSIQLLYETFRNAQNLETLDLSGNCFGKKAVGYLAKLARGCQNLRLLKLQNMPQLSEDNITYLKKANSGLDVVW